MFASSYDQRMRTASDYVIAQRIFGSTKRLARRGRLDANQGTTDYESVQVR